MIFLKRKILQNKSEGGYVFGKKSQNICLIFTKKRQTITPNTWEQKLKNFGKLYFRIYCGFVVEFV